MAGLLAVFRLPQGVAAAFSKKPQSCNAERTFDLSRSLCSLYRSVGSQEVRSSFGPRPSLVMRWIGDEYWSRRCGLATELRSLMAALRKFKVALEESRHP